MQHSYEDYLPILSSLPLFYGIREVELQNMLGCLGGYIKTYKKDEFIIMKEDEVNHVGIILKGKVQMIREDLWGNRSVLVLLHQGELLGETFVCGEQEKSTVSFQTGAETILLLLPFKKVMCSCSMACTFHHRLIENMVTLIANKNVALMDKVDVLSKKSLREKIATYLMQEAVKNKSTYFDLPLGRVQMAEYLCADRSALTRELNVMKEEGLIDFERNSFRVLKSLEQL